MRLFPTLLLFLAFDCGMPTEPRYGDRVQLSVQAVHPGPGDTAQIRSVTRGNGTVTIVGRINTPNPCYSFAAYRSNENGFEKFTVVATPDDGGCVQSIGIFEYTLTSGVSSCPSILVDYHYPKTGWADRRVLEDRIYCAM